MELKVTKVNGETSIKIIVSSKEEEFDYPKLINSLYEGEKVIMNFSEDINAEEQRYINEMFESIEKIVKENKDSKDLATEPKSK